VDGGARVSVESVLANASLVKGFLVPIFYDEHTSRSALGPTDFAKVRDGYACARCLAEYTTYLVRCPVCSHERDLAADLEAPDPLQVDHLREREHTQGMDSPAPRGFDEFMADVNADPDIDHTTLKKLGPRRRK
jgi:hypothetical protein